jgi:hypothetical protein
VCCFSPVSAPTTFLARLFGLGGKPRQVHVSKTSIFAAMVEDVQTLIYSMTLSVRGEVAMILPIPIARGAAEDAVKFVSLDKYPRFFDDAAEGFYFPAPQSAAKGGWRSAGGGMPRQKLVVHEVGAFVASYVPSRGDFDRLDARFRLPDEVWAAMKTYADWGFAVFQLKPGKKQIHPMAFRFPTRDRERLFFPTVHVHDGRVHAEAKFDHSLYYQHPALATNVLELPPGWNGDLVSPMSAANFMTLNDCAGLVVGAAPMAKRTLSGKLPNEDTWIDLALHPAEGAKPTPLVLIAR